MIITSYLDSVVVYVFGGPGLPNVSNVNLPVFVSIYTLHIQVVYICTCTHVRAHAHHTNMTIGRNASAEKT